MNFWDSFTNYFQKEKYKYVVVGAGTYLGNQDSFVAC